MPEAAFVVSVADFDAASGCDSICTTLSPSWTQRYFDDFATHGADLIDRPAKPGTSSNCHTKSSVRKALSERTCDLKAASSIDSETWQASPPTVLPIRSFVEAEPALDEASLAQEVAVLADEVSALAQQASAQEAASFARMAAEAEAASFAAVHAEQPEEAVTAPVSRALYRPTLPQPGPLAPK